MERTSLQVTPPKLWAGLCVTYDPSKLVRWVEVVPVSVTGKPWNTTKTNTPPASQLAGVGSLRCSCHPDVDSGSWLLHKPGSSGGIGVALVERKDSFQEPALVSTITCLDWIYGHHQSTRPHPTVEGISMPWGMVTVYLSAALLRNSVV